MTVQGKVTDAAWNSRKGKINPLNCGDMVGWEWRPCLEGL